MSNIISELSFLYWDFYVYYFAGSLTTPEAGVLTTLKSPRCVWTPPYRTDGRLQCKGEGPICRDEKGALGIHTLLILPASIPILNSPVTCSVSIWINVQFFSCRFWCKAWAMLRIWSMHSTMGSAGDLLPCLCWPSSPIPVYLSHATRRKASQTGVILSICTDTKPMGPQNCLQKYWWKQDSDSYQWSQCKIPIFQQQLQEDDDASAAWVLKWH